MAKIICPNCTQNLHATHQPLQQGQQLQCTQCKIDFEVVNIYPVELKPVTLSADVTPKPPSAINCPSCERRIRLQPTLKAGQKILCKACQAELTVIGLNPLELDLVPARKTRSKPTRQSKVSDQHQFETQFDSKRGKGKADRNKRGRNQQKHRDWDDD